MFKFNPKANASILTNGQGEKINSRAQEITLKVSGVNSEFASTFEIGIPPGFDSGAHYHSRTEEMFYVLSGTLLFMAFEPVEYTESWFDWVGKNGARPTLCHAGTLIHIPNYVPHAFANISSKAARVLFQASPPPDHEEYFRGLIAILNKLPIDLTKVAELRKKHDVHQFTNLRYLTPEELISGSKVISGY